MMARQRHDDPLSARERHAHAPLDLGGARQSALAADLAAAAELLDRDPDAAALRLDGLLHRIAVGWFQARGLPVPPSDRVLERLADHDASFAWRLRLALRAPDAGARLVAARLCLRSESDV